jgi:hypothetical protein
MDSLITVSCLAGRRNEQGKTINQESSLESSLCTTILNCNSKEVGSANGNRTEMTAVQSSPVGSKCLQTRSTGLAGMLPNPLWIRDVVTRLSLGCSRQTDRSVENGSRSPNDALRYPVMYEPQKQQDQKEPARCLHRNRPNHQYAKRRQQSRMARRAEAPIGFASPAPLLRSHHLQFAFDVPSILA